ncbi:2568_t:CDS:1 [Acaulospora morrowiae]|uniref:2568_t:CDS:1 n=1 Tax=Acaulospora morrowiae TaxID=94023 RepID=A0A9N8V6E4_9GLOM|nr:2568_t:CDS:1 [Acaulospora morrowiae]
MTTNNVSGLPGIPFQYHAAYDVKYRNAAISMDSDDMYFENEGYGDEEYSERSIYLSNDMITDESYNRNRLQKRSNEDYSNEEYSGKFGNTINSGSYNRLQKSPNGSVEYLKVPNYLSENAEDYNYNRLQKPSYESIGLPNSPKHDSRSGLSTPRINNSGLLTPRSNYGDLLNPRGNQYQLPSPTPSYEEDDVTKKSTRQQPKLLPPTPKSATPPSPNKKQRKNFSLGKSFTSLISGTRPKFRSFNKKSSEELHISDSTTIVREEKPSDASLPALTPSSPISHQLPEYYFLEDHEKDDRPEEANPIGSTVEELCKLVLIMQKGFREMENEIKELKLEIRKLKGEQVEEIERDFNGRLRSVKSFTRQMERYGGEGRWFHNDNIL